MKHKLGHISKKVTILLLGFFSVAYLRHFIFLGKRRWSHSARALWGHSNHWSAAERGRCLGVTWHWCSVSPSCGWDQPRYWVWLAAKSHCPAPWWVTNLCLSLNLFSVVWTKCFCAAHPKLAEGLSYGVNAVLGVLVQPKNTSDVETDAVASLNREPGIVFLYQVTT